VYGIAIADYATKTPVVGANVKLCDRADDACQSPLGGGQTDPNGQIGFYVPVTSPGFTGYLDVTALGYYPTVIVASSPLVDDTFSTALIPLLSTGQTLAKQAGTTLDTTRASLAMTVLGCNGLGLPYVSLSVDTADGATTMFYAGQNATTSTALQGIAIAFNAPVAPANVVAKFPLTGQVVSSASNVPTRKGTLTEVRLTPN
jgi:hypothetical protein